METIPVLVGALDQFCEKTTGIIAGPADIGACSSVLRIIQ